MCQITNLVPKKNTVMNFIFKSNFYKDAILTGGGVVYASTRMYVSMLYLYVARESEIQTARESQLNKIILQVNISFRYRWLLTHISS